MARKRSVKAANTGNEPIPPGATRKAVDRPLNPPEQGPPGSGGGPRHAAADRDSTVEEYGPARNEPLAEPPGVEAESSLEQGPPYAGPSGGAVGGTPAQGRTAGGHVRGGIDPGGVHRGDSTIGSDPKPTKK